MEKIALVIGSAVALVFIVVCSRVLLAGAASRHWRQVRGTVRHVVIECGTQRGELDRFTARVDYEYVFEGAHHRNCEFVGQTSTYRDVAVNYGSAYAAGQQIDVYVDPGKPGTSTLHPGVKWGYLVGVLFGIALLVFFMSRFMA